MFQLQHEDQILLIDALKELREFRSENSRIDLIHRIIGGFPKLIDALGYVHWNNAISAANDVVGYLEGREVAPGVPALGVIAQAIEPISPSYKAPLAQSLARMKLGASKSEPAPTFIWHDSRKRSEVFQERILGENTLQPMYYLRRALRAADAVVRVDINGFPTGTGFMVAPDLMITNNHVIKDEPEARNARAIFFNDVKDPAARDADSSPAETTARPAAAALLHTNRDLDYSIIRLLDCPKLNFYFSICPVLAKPNQRVMIIQHAKGFPKQISMQNNLVAMADAQIVQYYTSTDYGSSGSPVLNNDFAVVAIHCQWDDNPGWTGENLRIIDDKQIPDRQFRNQGSSMIAVVDDLRKQSPDLLQELTIVSK